MGRPERNRQGWAKGIWVFLGLSAAIWLLNLLGLRYWQWMHSQDAAQLLLLYPGYPYYDFTIFIPSFDHWHTQAFYLAYHGVPYAYPATSGLMLAFFYRLFGNPLMAFFRTIQAIPVVAGSFLAVALVRRGMKPVLAGGLMLLTLAMSYPWWFEWQRGNIEAVLFAVAALAVAAYWRRWYWLAAVLIGVDTAAKLYPVTLLGLLVARRRYKEAAAGLAVAVAMNELGLWVLGPTRAVASSSIKAGMEVLRLHAVMGYFGMGYDHSLLALVKCLVYQPNAADGSQYTPWLTAYMVAVAVGGVVLYFARIVRLPRTNQVMALVIVSVLIPPVSFEYTLIHLYVAWAVLVLYAQRATETKPLVGMFALMAVLMSPEGALYFMNVRVAGQVKCVALVWLLVQVLRWPMEEEALPAIA